jgi:acetoin utilization deacetylase AcuC-like enzyme
LIEHLVVPVARSYEPELILVSAGFDAHRADPLAQCMLEVESFAEMARHVRALGDELGAPVGAVLEGGYDLGALAASVAATMDALATGGAPASGQRGELTRQAAAYVGRHWELAAT